MRIRERVLLRRVRKDEREMRKRERERERERERVRKSVLKK